MCGKYKCTRWNDKVYIQDIKRNPNCPQRDVDKWGNALQTVQGAKGDGMRTLHDASVAAVAKSLRSAQVKFRDGGSGNITCAHILSDLLFLCTGGSKKKRLLDGTTAHLAVDLSDVGSSDFLAGWRNSHHAPWPSACLLDAKTLACGRTYMGLIPEGPLDGKTHTRL